MASPANALPLPTEAPPLRVDDGGAVRVGNSRVSLDLIVEQYDNGMTPEDMVRAYDTLALADVHAVISYYLRYGDEVRAYLNRRALEAESLRARGESARPAVSREDLLARQRASEKADAPPGECSWPAPPVAMAKSRRDGPMPAQANGLGTGYAWEA